MSSKNTIYMDHASATPMDTGVYKMISKYEKDFYANPSGVHKGAIEIHKIIEDSRSSIAKQIGAHSDEIIFTGSGTESDALAILGLVYKYIEVGPALPAGRLPNIPHIVTMNIEHPAVMENCKMLQKRGIAEVTYVPVEANGIVDPKKIYDAIKENTVLVTVMYANNEIGTIQNIQEIAKGIRRFRKWKQDVQILSRVGAPVERVKREELAHLAGMSRITPFFHTDACQAMNYLYTENVEKLGVDMMSFNGSKIYGPKGIGVLYKKRSVPLAPIYAGGGQEINLRSGTENMPYIVGVAKALEVANKIKNKELKRLVKLRDYFFNQIVKLEKSTGFKIYINGDRENRLPNNINISILGISNELLAIELDAKGVAISNRSACKSTDEESSHVIHALRQAGQAFPSEESLRITLGRSTTLLEVKKVLKFLQVVLQKYRNIL